MLTNPFDAILDEIRQLADKLDNLPTVQKTEILTEEELCSRLRISRSTAGLWRKKKKLPFFKIGDVIRYDLGRVLLSLEKPK